MRNRTLGKGFTLIELMIVVAILGILAGIAIPQFNKYINASKTSEANENLRSMADHALAYYNTEHFFDINGIDKRSGYYPGCEATDNTAQKACGATDADTCLGISPKPKPGTRISPNDVNFNTQPWLRLGFNIGVPMHYCYNYKTSNNLTTFDGTATGSFDEADDSVLTISGDSKGHAGVIKQKK